MLKDYACRLSLSKDWNLNKYVTKQGNWDSTFNVIECEVFISHYGYGSLVSKLSNLYY